MKRVALILPLFLSLLNPALAVSIPKEDVSADAKWLIHLEAAQFRSTKVGGFIVTELLEKKLSQPVGQLKSKLKLDLDVDKIINGINSVTIYGTDYKSLQDNAVLLLRTSPDLQDILVGVLAGMTLAGTNAPMQIAQTQEGSVSLYTIQDTAYCAVVPGKAIVMGRSREVTENAVKVLLGKAPSLPSGAAFGGFEDTTEAFFFLGIAQGFNVGSNLPPQARILQMTDAGRVVMGEDSNQVFLNLALRGKTTEVVTQMQQVAQGLIALGSLSQPEDKDAAQLLRSIQVSTAGNMVNIRLDYPVDKALAHLAEARDKATAKRHDASQSGGNEIQNPNPPPQAATPPSTN